MINLPRAQNGCTTMVLDVHRRNRPVISLLQWIEAGELVQNVVYVSQIVQALTTPAFFFSVKINRAKEPRPTSCFQQENLYNLKVHLRCKLPKPVKIQGPICTCGKQSQRDGDGSSLKRVHHRHTQSRVPPPDVKEFP